VIVVIVTQLIFLDHQLIVIVIFEEIVMIGIFEIILEIIVVLVIVLIFEIIFEIIEKIVVIAKEEDIIIDDHFHPIVINNGEEDQEITEEVEVLEDIITLMIAILELLIWKIFAIMEDLEVLIVFGIQSISANLQKFLNV